MSGESSHARNLVNAARTVLSGGDLLIYDTARYDHRGLTRLVAADNTIVFFPSDALHEVTPVRCEDGEFKSGRFTLNGWIHAI